LEGVANGVLPSHSARFDSSHLITLASLSFLFFAYALFFFPPPVLPLKLPSNPGLFTFLLLFFFSLLPQENFVTEGPDFHDKLAKYGIEIYAAIDAYSQSPRAPVPFHVERGTKASWTSIS
jgi:hypothetical protein